MVSSPLPAIRQATAARDFEVARTLFLEYAAWLSVDLCFQGFNEEVATLPGAYAPPSGRLLLAEADAPVGVVALRPLLAEPGTMTCELKRLWVRPGFRGLRVGHALTEAALDEARRIGYRAMKLDTLPTVMPNAVALYRELGFTECAPYYCSQIPGSMYMERVL